MRRFALVVAIVLFSSSVAEASISFGIFGTGVNDQGVALVGDGIAEQHYTFVFQPSNGASQTAFVVVKADPWVANPVNPDARWIGPNPTGGLSSDPVGTYFYHLTFNLTPEEAQALVVKGQWATDNPGEIFLNGVSTGQATGDADFGHLTPFTLSSGFQGGDNELVFKVTNIPLGDPEPPSGNPNGLLVQITSAELPEPGSLLTWSVLVGAFAMVAWRRRRAA